MIFDDTDMPFAVYGFVALICISLCFRIFGLPLRTERRMQRGQ